MAKRKETKLGPVSVTDWGTPEYLDGAQMQFMVTYKKRGDRFDRCAAYFAELEHAIAFAELLRAALSMPADLGAPNG